MNGDTFNNAINDILGASDEIIDMYKLVLESIHNGGIVYESSGQSGVPKVFKIIKVDPNDLQTIKLILDVANSEPALVGLTEASLISLATKGLALVGIEVLESGAEVFSSYLGAEDLSVEEVVQRKGSGPFCEIRSSVTLPSIRGYGLNTIMKMIQTINIIHLLGLAPIAFTDDIPAFEDLIAIKSSSFGINTKLGFIRVLVADLPEKLKAELVGPCPTGRCANRGDDHPACGCSIWVPDKTQVMQEWSIVES